MNINKKRNDQITATLIVGSFCAAYLCFWLFSNVFETWNSQIYDKLFLLRSYSETLKPGYDDTVVHVDLNNTSIERLNDFYLNRSIHAQVIRNLAAMNVSIQLYDFIFASRSTNEDDEAIIAATEEAGNVYFGLAFHLRTQESSPRDDNKKADGILNDERAPWQVIVDGDDTELYEGTNPLATFAELASASRGLGNISLTFDRDGVCRRLPLIIAHEGMIYPSFPFRAVCDYLGVPPEKIVVSPGKTITLEDAKRPGDAAGHDITIPIDRHGNMIINFAGPWERMKHYNYVDVLRASDDRVEMEMWKEELSGKIVVISEVTTGSSDVAPVPTDTAFPLSGLHANVIHTILTESFIKKLSPHEMFFIEVLLIFGILAMALRLSSFFFSLGTLSVAGGYVFLTALLFFHANVIFYIVRPVIMVLFALVFIVAHRYLKKEKEKESLRKTFEAYFPPSIVKKLLANPGMIYSRGQKEELTVMFTDINNFTGFSTAMEPDHILKLLNEYFEEMTRIVFRYQGTVDKLIGDGMMVFFGNPDPQPDHALRCVKAAVDMQEKVREISVRWENKGGIPLRIRIGINTDTVVVGNMGSPMRLSYTVIGSAVNLAHRIENNAPVGGILISERTYDLVKDHISAHRLDKIKVKGFDEPVVVYEVPVA